MQSKLQNPTENAGESLRRTFSAEADAVVKRAQEERKGREEMQKEEAKSTSESLLPADVALTTEERELWLAVRRELVWHNLFGPREYCKRMAMVSLISGAGYIVLLLLSRGLYGVNVLANLLPLVFWGLAFSLYARGGHTQGIHDQKVMLPRDGKQETLNETTIKATAIVNRDQGRDKARAGDFLFWIGVVLGLFFAIVLPAMMYMPNLPRY